MDGYAQIVTFFAARIDSSDESAADVDTQSSSRNSLSQWTSWNAGIIGTFSEPNVVATQRDRQSHSQ
jgi:hypothetical protein